MLARIKDKGDVSYQRFTDAAELQLLDENDLAVLLSERFSLTQTQGGGIPGDAVPAAGALPVPPTPDRRPRPGFAQRIAVDERTLADTPVLDPARTVRTDVERVLWV